MALQRQEDTPAVYTVTLDIETMGIPTLLLI